MQEIYHPFISQKSHHISPSWPKCRVTIESNLWKMVLLRDSTVSTNINRDHSRFAPSEWETVLLCNDVSHWLGASLESALHKSSQHKHNISYIPAIHISLKIQSNPFVTFRSITWLHIKCEAENTGNLPFFEYAKGTPSLTIMAEKWAYFFLFFCLSSVFYKGSANINQNEPTMVPYILDMLPTRNNSLEIGNGTQQLANEVTFWYEFMGPAYSNRTKPMPYLLIAWLLVISSHDTGCEIVTSYRPWHQWGNFSTLPSSCQSLEMIDMV